MSYLRTPDRNVCLRWLRENVPQVVGVIDCSGLPRFQCVITPCIRTIQMRSLDVEVRHGSYVIEDHTVSPPTITVITP